MTFRTFVKIAAAMVLPLSTALAGNNDLAFEITVETDPAIPGETFYYQATLSHTGSGTPLNDIEISLTIPEGLDDLNRSLTNAPQGVIGGCNQVSAAASCQAGETLIISFASLDPGSSRSVRGPMRIAADTLPGSAIDLAFQASYDGIGAPIGRLESIDVENPGSVDLDVQLGAASSLLDADGLLRYEISYGNSGANSAANVGLELDLPDGVSLIGADDGGMLTGNTVTWDLGSLTAGQGGRREVIVQDTVGGAARLMTAEARISSTTASDRAGFIAVDGTDLLATATAVRADPIAPESQTIFEAIVANTSPVTLLEDVALSLRIPAGLASANRSLTNLPLSLIGGCNQVSAAASCEAVETLIVTIGDLEPGQSRRVAGLIPIAVDTLRGSVAPFVFSSSHAAATATRFTTEAVVVGDALSQTTLSTLLSVTPKPGTSGAEESYSVYYGNSGQFAADDVSLVLALPSDTTFVSGSSGAVNDNGIVTWALASIAPGSAGQVSVVATNDTLTNGSLLTANVEIQDTLGDEPDDRSEVANAIGSSVLAIESNLESSPVAPGDRMDYGATITNTTATTLLQDVRVEVRIPEGLSGLNRSLVNAPGAVIGGCNQVSAAASCEANETLILTYGDLAAGASRMWRGPLVVAPTTAQGELIPLDMQAVHDDQDAPVVRQEIFSAQTPLADSDLRLFVSADVAPLALGNDVTYTLTFGNRGLSTAQNVRLRVALPDSLAVVSVDDFGVVDSGIASWALGSIPPGFGGRRSITLSNLSPGEPRVLKGQASISAQGGSRPDDQAAVTMATGTNFVDLSLVTDTGDADPGESVSLTSSITNVSATALLEDVTFTLRIPEGLSPFNRSEFISAAGTIGGCNQVSASASCIANETLVVTIGDLAAGETAEVSGAIEIANDTPRGSVIPWVAEVSYTFADGISTERVVLDNVAGGIVPSDIIFRDGFE